MKPTRHWLLIGKEFIIKTVFIIISKKKKLKVFFKFVLIYNKEDVLRTKDFFITLGIFLIFQSLADGRY